MALVSREELFSPEEARCAIELIDSALFNPADDYRMLVAAARDDVAEIVGYVCYGPTPMTQSTYDLYWLATSPEHQGKGIAKALCAAMEAELVRRGGRLLRVETGSADHFGAAHRFYERQGYEQACRVADFYRPGDDLLLLFKRLG